MDDIFFQKIFNEIEPVLPNEWQNLVLYVGYALGRYSVKYYVSNADGEYVDCFKQGIDKAQLIEIFTNINKIAESMRETSDGNGRWTVMTMIVASTGQMKAEFDYTDISENMISYEQEWKAKYLK